MGSWQYYTVKMSMRELADNVKFAADIYDDRTLDDAIQRVLNESRVNAEIVTYLIRQPDRFFSSIVVAALSGNPKWFPVTMEDDERFLLFREDTRFSDTFGVLSFDGTQGYYALDGQHRLAAIKALVDPNSAVSPNAPTGFKDEEISVIVVVPSEAESHDQFMTRYRRLFGNLNRYAKPTDAVTNIIMDEDDAFAIITRRLITEHKFFRYSGRQKESARVKTRKGKNLRHNDSYFTSLETLYAINIALLSSRHRKNNGWNPEGVKDHREYLRFRPEEEQLEALFDELCLYWNALIEELPFLLESPSSMRDHSAPAGDGNTQDNFLFWPIGQELLADIARDLMDLRQPDSKKPTRETVKAALLGLSSLTWDAHQAPWRNLVLIPDAEESKTWRIRSEDRKSALNMMRRIFRWQLGIDELAQDEVGRLRDDWKALLLPAVGESAVDDLWKEIESDIMR
jgi:DNA sulfur modification protein DndB